MSVVTSNEYDHIDVVAGSTTNRHYLKDTVARNDIDGLKSAQNIRNNELYTIDGFYFKKKTGAFSSQSGYNVCLARCKQGDTLFIDAFGYTNNYPHYAFLDSTLSVIQPLGNLETLKEYHNYKVIAPQGAAYIVVNGGDVVTPTCRLSLVGDEFDAAVNLVNGNEMSNGTIYTGKYFKVSSNALTDADGYNCIRMQCKEGDVLSISGEGYGTSYAPWVFRNIAGEIIEKCPVPVGGKLLTTYDQIVTAPSGTVEVFVSANLITAKCYRIYGTKWIEENFVATGNIIDGKYYYAKNNRIADDNGYAMIDVECNEGDIFVVSGGSYKNVYYAWLFMNGDTQLSHFDNTATYSSFTPCINALITAPANATHLVVSTDKAANECKILKFGKVRDILVNDITHKPFTGKKIVWFGTSISAGKVGGKTIPDIVGNITGATIYNEAVPSSEMSIYNTANECRARALSYTQEEKAAMDWWASLTDAEKTAGLAASRDVIFDKYLSTGSAGSMDVYVFEHGYNDYNYQNPEDYTSDPVNEFDREYPMGAASYLIDRILSDNPRARIVWVGHYENALLDPTNHQSWGKPVAEFQEKLCAKYGIPLVRVWDKTGWSNPNKVTITGYWNDGYWVNNGGTQRQDYVKNCMFPDGIHPYRDKSGRSQYILANIIAAFIDTLE